MLFIHRIAGITIRTETDVEIPHLRDDPFALFSISNGKPDIHQRIYQFNPNNLTSPPLDDRERTLILSSMDFVPRWLDNPILRSPQIYEILQRCLASPESMQIEMAWNRMIIRNYADNEIDLIYHPERREDIASPLFVAGYRNMVATFLPNFSAVMIHAAGVIHNGNAVVFLAPDEGGKTSVVEDLAIDPVLNDDHIILRQDKDSVIIAHATPLGKITSGPQFAKLGVFFLLEKAPRFDIIPIKPQYVLQYLWNEHLYFSYGFPKSLKVRAFEILASACHNAATYRVRLPKHFLTRDIFNTAMERLF